MLNFVFAEIKGNVDKITKVKFVGLPDIWIVI
jgi:hypothetical protein